MLQPTFPPHAILLFLLVTVAIPVQAAEGRPRDDFKGMSIVALMQKYGHPDQIVASGRRDQDRAYRWRLKTTASFEGPDEAGRHEDFFCDVTAVVGQTGRVKRFEARPADVGASALASAEAFGPMCKKTFGSHPRRAHDEKLARMRL